jgi:hypothetical protein
MPKKIEIEVFTVEELEPKVQEKVLDKNRHNNTEDGFWSKWLLEDWKQKLANEGFIEPEIHFSGFNSQGDGASFDAKINISFFTTQTEGEVLEASNVRYTIEKNSFANHYSHEKTRFVNWEADSCECSDIAERIAKKIENARLTLCKEIYASLEEEHDYQTSDEKIKEDLLNNECLFLADGTPYRE